MHSCVRAGVCVCVSDVIVYAPLSRVHHAYLPAYEQYLCYINDETNYVYALCLTAADFNRCSTTVREPNSIEQEEEGKRSGSTLLRMRQTLVSIKV